MASRRRGGIGIPIRLDKRGAERDAQELGRELKSSIQPVVDVFGAAKTAVSIFGDAMDRVRRLVGDAVEAGAEQERVEVRVTRAIQLRNKFTREDLKLLQEANAARQQLVGVGDEVQLQLQGTAALLGVQAKDLSRVTEATLGLVEVTGGSIGLNEAIRVTSKLYQGNTGALKEYGLEVKTANEGLDLLQGKFRGLATGTETFAQKTDRLRANWSDLVEQFGRTFTDNKDVRQLIDDLSSTTLDWLQGIRENGPEVQRQISGFVTELRALGGWVAEHRDDILTLTKLFVAGKAIGSVAGVAATLKGLGIGGAVAAGGRAIAGRVGLGALGSAGAVAGAAAGGTGLLFSGFSAASGIGDLRRRARERAAAERAAAFGVKKNTPRFNMEFEAGFVDFEAQDFAGGAGGLEVEVKKSELDRRRREAEKAAREEQKREEDAFLAWLADRRDTRLRIEQLDFENRERVRRIEGEADVIALQAQREVVEERNRILFHGYKTKEEMDQAHAKKTQQWAATMKQITAGALGDFFRELGASIATGGLTVTKLLGGFIAQIGQSFGSMLITIGTAAIAGGTASTVAPWLASIFGGPPGVAGGVALVAAGGLLMGLSGAVGAAVSGAGAGGASAAAGRARAPRAPQAPGFESPEIPSFDASRQARGGPGFGGGGRLTVLNVAIDGARGFMIGTAEELARYMAQLLGDHQQAYGVG